jgi:hypothetical protein
VGGASTSTEQKFPAQFESRWMACSPGDIFITQMWGSYGNLEYTHGPAFLEVQMSAALPSGGGSSGATQAISTDALLAPPKAAQFSLTTSGRSATTTLTLRDHAAAGLIAEDLSTTDIRGFKGAVRAIPAAQQGSFTFIARIRTDQTGWTNSGAGIIVSTGTGTAVKSQFMILGYGVGGGSAHGPYGGYWDNGSYTDLSFGKASEFQWQRVQISGTVATFSHGRDGVLFTPYAVRDFGATITHYGFVTHRYDNGVSGLSCPYFESTEFPGVLLA